MSWWSWLWDAAEEEASEPSDALRGFSKDEIGKAALRLIYSRLPHVSPAYLGGTLEEVARARSRINDLRAEYASFEPVRMRREIMGWLEWSLGKANETETDIVTGKSKRNQEKYSRERQREETKTAEILARLAKHDPPH